MFRKRIMIKLLYRYGIVLLTFIESIASTCTFKDNDIHQSIYKYSFLSSIRPYGDVIAFFDSSNEHFENISAAVNEISSVSSVALQKQSELNENFQDAIVYLFPSDEKSLLRIFEQIHAAFVKTYNLNKYWRPVFIILWPPNLNFHEGHEILRNTNFWMDTDIYIAYHYSNSSWDTNSIPTNTDFLISGIYSIKGILMVESFKLDTPMEQDIVCRMEESTIMYPLLRKVFRRQDFRGAPIIAIEIVEAVSTLSRHAQYNNVTNETIFIGGYDVHQYWYLRDSLNFTGIDKKAIGWISTDDFGTPTGMNAQLINGEADISIASSVPYSEKPLFFLQPINTAELYAFFVQPARQSYLYTHTRPFQLMAWICMFLVWMLSSLCIIVFVKVKTFFGENVRDNDKYLSNGAIFWAIFLIASKCWNRTPESSSLKFIMISGLMLTLVTYTEYTSILITFFSIEILPIQNFSDIVNMKFAIYASGLKDSAAFALGESKGILRPEESALAIPKIFDSRSAFVGISEELYTQVENNKFVREKVNLISMVLVSSVRTKAGAFVKRGSPFEEFFNYKLIQLFENGIRHRLAQNTRKLISDIKVYNVVRNMHQITVVDSTIPFAILNIGFLLSFIIYISEKMKYRKTPLRDNNY